MKALEPPHVAPKMVIEEANSSIWRITPPDCRDARGEVLDNLCGGHYGIARGEIGARGKRPFAAGTIAARKCVPAKTDLELAFTAIPHLYPIIFYLRFSITTGN